MDEALPARPVPVPYSIDSDSEDSDSDDGFGEMIRIGNDPGQRRVTLADRETMPNLNATEDEEFTANEANNFAQNG